MASKKKGLSLEEKIVKVEEWFSRNPHPFTLKELQVLIPKATGVIVQSLDECLELLVSENRVASDRLGVSVMYWKFVPTASTGPATSSGGPSGRGAQRVRSAEDIAASLSEEELRARIGELQASIQELGDATRSRRELCETVEERHENDELMRAASRDLAQLRLEVEQYAERDPDAHRAMHLGCHLGIDAVNRWTDNVLLMEQFVCRRSARMTSLEFRSRFGIPAEFDFFTMEDATHAP